MHDDVLDAGLRRVFDLDLPADPQTDVDHRRPDQREHRHEHAELDCGSAAVIARDARKPKARRAPRSS
jgi:hypothetical protein